MEDHEVHAVEPQAGPFVGLVGAGAASRALASQWSARGVDVAVWSRDPAQAEALVRDLGLAPMRAARDLAVLVGRDLVLCVSDDALEHVAERVSDEVPRRDERAALHTSGAHGREALAPLAEKGWSTGGLHPLVALPPRGDGAPLLGAWFALEGDGVAGDVAAALVQRLQGRVLELAPGASKLRYHAGASLAAGGAVALLALAEDELAAAGIERVAAREALVDLALGALAGVRRDGAGAALTGAAARGDTGLVAAHLGAVAPVAREAYRALLPTLVRLARERGTLDEAALAALDELARDGRADG